MDVEDGSKRSVEAQEAERERRADQQDPDGDVARQGTDAVVVSLALEHGGKGGVVIPDAAERNGDDGIHLTEKGHRHDTLLGKAEIHEVIAENTRHGVAGLDDPNGKSFPDDFRNRPPGTLESVQPERDLQEAADQDPGKKRDEIGDHRCQGRALAAHPYNADKEDIQPDVHHICRDDQTHREKGLADDGQKIGDVCQRNACKDKPAQITYIAVKGLLQRLRAAEGPCKPGAKKHQSRKQDHARDKSGEHGGGKIGIRPFLLFICKVLRIQQRPAQTRDRIDHGGHEHDRCTEIYDCKGILAQKPPDDHAVRKFAQRHAHGG